MSAAPDTLPQEREAELHIAGALVHTRQPHTLTACAQMAQLPGVEVVQTSDEGRAVLVLEGPSARAIVDMLEQIRSMEGVLNVALVYQHAETLTAMQEELEP